MTRNNAIAAVLDGRSGAEAAIRKFSEGGLDIKHFLIADKGCRPEEKASGFAIQAKACASGGINGFQHPPQSTPTR